MGRVALGIGRVVPVVAVCAVLAAAQSRSPAAGETKFTVDPLSSIAWFQVLPHLNRLWGTTCPQERSWLPPAGHDNGGEDASDIGRSTWKVVDTSKVPIPLLPRYRVRPVCTYKAVRGELVVPDTSTWTGAHGEVSVDAAALTQGQTWDDNYMHTVLLDAQKYPEITLKIDSVVDVTTDGDSIRAMAMGTLTLHGVDTPEAIHIVAWHDAGGIRVRGRWHFPAQDLIDVYHMPALSLGLGVGMHIWKQMWMGIDMVMRPEVATS